MNLNIKVDDKEVEQAFKKLSSRMSGSVVLEAAEAGGKVIEVAADAKAPGPHIVMKVTEQGPTHAEISIGPDKEHWYYKFHEFGASAHQIRAKDAALLAFEGRRGPVLTPSVQHPGMAARPFLRPAITQQRRKASEAAGNAFRKALKP